MSTNPPPPPGDPGPFTQEIRHSQISARVPEKVARGVFSTGAVVLQGPHEFVLDFLLRLTQPHALAARVVLPATIMPSFIAALRENLNNYTTCFPRPVVSARVFLSAPQVPALLATLTRSYQQYQQKLAAQPPPPPPPGA